MKRSKITTFPREVRAWLDKALAEKNFAGYKKFEEELRQRGHYIGKSSIQRYGSALEEQLQAIRDTTRAAAMVAETAPDDADLRSAAVISMAQSGLFEVMLLIRRADAEVDAVKRMKLLSTAASSIAELSRASVNQKKHEIEHRGKTEAAADAAAKIAKKGGLTKDAVDSIRREILGIAA